MDEVIFSGVCMILKRKKGGCITVNDRLLVFQINEYWIRGFHESYNTQNVVAAVFDDEWPYLSYYTQTYFNFLSSLPSSSYHISPRPETKYDISHWYVDNPSRHPLPLRSIYSTCLLALCTEWVPEPSSPDSYPMYTPQLSFITFLYRCPQSVTLLYLHYDSLKPNTTFTYNVI